MQPIYQVLVYGSELNNFMIHGLRAHRETAVPLAAQITITQQTIGG